MNVELMGFTKLRNISSPHWV